MADRVNKTLGELATSLAVRLGFANQGEVTQLGNPLMSQLLQDSQDLLMAEWKDEVLRVVKTDRSTAVGQTMYDIRDDMDVGQIKRLAVKVGSVWHNLARGIEYYHQSNNTGSYPLRYDIRMADAYAEATYGARGPGQIEVWPEPGGVYSIWEEYYKRVGSFSDPTDRATVDDRILLMHALASGKAHFGKADAQVYGAQAERLLSRLRAQQIRNKRFFFGAGEAENDEYSIPVDFDTQTV
jgi:hypothetical protein